MMDLTAELTPREREVAELCAWGAAKKEIADKLCISESTVANHTRNIFSKTGCTKVNELAAWWFCKTYHISFDLSPLKRKMLALLMLCLMMPQIWHYGDQLMRTRVRVNTRTAKVVRGRKADDMPDMTLIDI